MSSIKIILDPPQSIYYPGDEVAGYILVYSAKEKKVNNILLEVDGRAYVRFRHGHSKQSTFYSAEKVYLKDRFIRWPKNTAKTEKRVVAGDTGFPFSFTIPDNAVPSLKGAYGYILYRLKAQVDIPWALDITDEIHIKVGVPLDLSSSPMYTQSQTASIYNNKICPSTLATISIPRLAWRAGEVISVYCNVTNYSSYDISGVEVKIVKKENCTGHMFYQSRYNITKEYMTEIKSTKTDISVPSMTLKQVHLDVRVPENLVTITNCSIIRVHYELEIKLCFNNTSNTCASTSLPVIFSNIPIDESPRSSQISDIEFQPSDDFPPPYRITPPVIGENAIFSFMPVPRSTLYPDAPPPYTLYASNPTLTFHSTPNISCERDSLPRYPSAPSVEYQ